MKPFLFLLLVAPLALADTPPPPSGGTPTKIPEIKVRKRPSHSDIMDKKKNHVTEKREERKVQEKPVVTVKKRSIVANSTLITSGTHWTLVPKGAVIYVPEKLKTKIVAHPKGELVDWRTFLRMNNGWLYVHNVSMKQAKGQAKLKPEAIKAYKGMSKIVIAACYGGPISVKEEALIVEEESSASAKR